jgi:hypothetical protein
MDHDHVTQFAEALRAAGLVLKGEPVFDNKVHRCLLKESPVGETAPTASSSKLAVEIGTFLLQYRTPRGDRTRARGAAERMPRPDAPL